MDCGCNTLPPCRSMTKPCWSLRHDHNQGTHGSDGIVNYERASWRAVKILTVGGFAAVGADTRQGLLVTSSFRGHQRPSCHLTDSRDCLKHLSRHRRNSSSSRCQRLPLPKVTKYRGQQLPPDSPFSIFAGSAQTISMLYVPHPSRPSMSLMAKPNCFLSSRFPTAPPPLQMAFHLSC